MLRVALVTCADSNREVLHSLHACMLSLAFCGAGQLLTSTCCQACRVWCKERREAICDALRVYHSPVSAITTDEHGFCWVASGGEGYRAGYAGLGAAAVWLLGGIR